MIAVGPEFSRDSKNKGKVCVGPVVVILHPVKEQDAQRVRAVFMTL